MGWKPHDEPSRLRKSCSRQMGIKGVLQANDNIMRRKRRPPHFATATYRIESGHEQLPQT